MLQLRHAATYDRTEETTIATLSTLQSTYLSWASTAELGPYDLSPRRTVRDIPLSS